MGKRDDAVAAIERRIEAELDQAEAERREANRKREQELLDSFLPVNPDPNVIGRNLQKLEHFVILGVSIFE